MILVLAEGNQPDCRFPTFDPYHHVSSRHESIVSVSSTSMISFSLMGRPDSLSLEGRQLFTTKTVAKNVSSPQSPPAASAAIFAAAVEKRTGSAACHVHTHSGVNPWAQRLRHQTRHRTHLLIMVSFCLFFVPQAEQRPKTQVREGVRCACVSQVELSFRPVQRTATVVSNSTTYSPTRSSKAISYLQV